jgi:hypothetical protein
MRKNVLELKNIILTCGYWSENVKNYLGRFDFTKAKKIHDKACIQVSEDYYKQHGIYKTPQQIYATINSDKQIKQDQDFAKQEYEKIKVPMIDYNELFV